MLDPGPPFALAVLKSGGSRLKAGMTGGANDRRPSHPPRGRDVIFKRFGANLRAQNWFAIGVEFAIVFAGVFVGTQVSNWNAGRLERAETARLIAQLLPELRAQVDFYDTAKAYYATTRRFAEVALAGWAGDAKVSDNAFVIAAYQASQIQGIGTNSATWANIFGADRLRSIGDPAIRRDLSFLMYSDNSSIGVDAVDTPYRSNVRRVIPIKVQDAIRTHCGDFTPDNRPNIVLLPQTCALRLPAEQAAAAARALRANPGLVDDLHWHVAAAEAFLANLKVFEDTTHKLLREIPS